MSAVDRIYGELQDSSSALLSAGHISLSIALDGNIRKVLLLSAASHFEHQLCDVVRNFVREASKEHALIASLVENKAISRQYHTWFQWDASNANQFFGLFGNDFKDYMREKVKFDPVLGEQIRAFLEIGNRHNLMVHNDYATFLLNKTPAEIYAIFRKGEGFIKAMAAALSEYVPAADQLG